MIMQYLADEGYNASQMTIQDESNVKWHEREENTSDTLRLKKAILGKAQLQQSEVRRVSCVVPDTRVFPLNLAPVDGEWTEVDKICSKPLFKNQKSFLFAVYKQQYLELIEHREMQKVIGLLSDGQRFSLPAHSIH